MIPKTLITALILVNCYCLSELWNVIIPISTVDRKQATISELQGQFRISEEIAEGVYVASEANGLNPKLYAHLVNSESRFKVHAVSPKGYKGLSQTPTATWRAKTDLMHGAEILREKLIESRGDMEEALTRYKGGLNPEARKQARQVLAKFMEVK